MKKAKAHKNILKYDGEFINGERNGKGKEYDKKGELIFEGEYLKGIRKRQNNYYILDNYIYYLLFEGVLKNGKYDGIAKEYKYNILPHWKLFISP